jgi:hypothetical protein
MKTDLLIEPNKTVFLQTVATALGNLKQQLQCDYELAYPDLREIIHLILDEEESRAWNLTSFPHLLLPDLVEAHVAKLNLRPVEIKHDKMFRKRHQKHLEDHQPVFALCA